MISIVMPYKNRRKQLIRTLHTINKSVEKDLEIIIVDDVSDEVEKVTNLSNLFDLNIKVIEITAKQHLWKNDSCITFNIGFGQARGDIIVFQSPECLHVGDILHYVKTEINDMRYICFSCYAISKRNMKWITTIDFENEDADQLRTSLIGVCENLDATRESLKASRKQCILENRPFLPGNIWYCHPEFRSWAPHFTAAMMKKVLLEEFGGFDERYKYARDYEDNELYCRIKRSNLEIIVPHPSKNPFVIHQYHTRTNILAEDGINRKLFNDVTKKETGWKVN